MKTKSIIKSKSLFLKYLSIFILGVTSVIFTFAYTTIETDLDNAVQYIQKIVLTDNTGSTGIVLDGDGDSYIVGSLGVGTNNAVGGTLVVEGEVTFDNGTFSLNDGNFNVAGGDVNFSNGTTFIEGQLEVDEKVTLGSGLEVDGVGYFHSNVDIDSNIISNGLISKGSGVVVNGDGGTAIGFEAQSNDYHSIAIGERAEANGYMSTAIGLIARANGTASIAMGEQTKAVGKGSMAMGLRTEANGLISTTMGIGTEANGTGSTAIGSYNMGLEDGLFEVGVGTGDLNRKNALTILSNGFVGIGTNIPGSELEVNGHIESDSIESNGDINAQGNIIIDGNMSIEGTSFMSGFVGIGTNMPGSELEVNGHIESDSIESNGNIDAQSYSINTSEGISYAAQYTGTDNNCHELEFQGGLLVGTGNC